MKKLIEQYKENGYCVLKGLIPENQSNNVVNEIHKIMLLQLARFKSRHIDDNSDIFSDMQELIKFDSDAYLAAARRSAKLASVTHYITHNKILDAVKSFGIELATIAAEPVLHITSDKLRIPNGYHGIEPHQDWPSIQGSLDCVVTWAPLVEVTENNFPLHVVPKSHRLGLLKGDITANAYKIFESEYDQKSFVPVPVSPGDVVLMSGWTIHKTGLDNCTGLRIAISNRWENACESTFINRNYPSAYIKSVHRELITENFPSQAQINKIFDDL